MERKGLIVREKKIHISRHRDKMIYRVAKKERDVPT